MKGSQSLLSLRRSGETADILEGAGHAAAVIEASWKEAHLEADFADQDVGIEMDGQVASQSARHDGSRFLVRHNVAEGAEEGLQKVTPSAFLWPPASAISARPPLLSCPT